MGQHHSNSPSSHTSHGLLGSNLPPHPHRVHFYICSICCELNDKRTTSETLCVCVTLDGMEMLAFFPASCVPPFFPESISIGRSSSAHKQSKNHRKKITFSAGKRAAFREFGCHLRWNSGCFFAFGSKRTEIKCIFEDHLQNGIKDGTISFCSLEIVTGGKKRNGRFQTINQVLLKNMEEKAVENRLICRDLPQLMVPK